MRYRCREHIILIRAERERIEPVKSKGGEGPPHFSTHCPPAAACGAGISGTEVRAKGVRARIVRSALDLRKKILT